MNIITSKYRILFIVKICLGYAFALVCLFIALSFCRAIYNYQHRNIALFFVVAILFFILIFTFQNLKSRKIIVVNENIEIHSFLNSKKTIPISEITSIERIRNYQQGKAGPISDGYYYSQLNVSDGFSFSISPDKFSNYSDIMIKIKSSLKN